MAPFIRNEVSVKVLKLSSSPAVLSRVACACVAMTAAWSGVARAEEMPLYLTLSQSLQRDSNFSRTTQPQSERISVTAVTAGLDKSYGRQNYKASAQVAAQRYDHFGKLLNNDAKNFDGSVSSDVGANWRLSLGGNFSENLTAPQDNQLDNRVVRNIRRYRDGNVSVQYGNGGRWSVVTTVDSNRLTYSDDNYAFRNAQQHSTGARLVYNASDLLNFGVGPRWVSTRYPNRNDETVDDRNLDFSTNWQVSGLSNLSALLSLRNSESSLTTGRRTNAFTGALGWAYTPRGLMTYGVNLRRATDSDRFREAGQASFFGSTYNTLQNVAFDNVTTTLGLSAQYLATAKLNFTLSYYLIRYESSNVRDKAQLGNTQFSIAGSNNDYNSRYNSVSLAANYRPIQAVGLSCSVQRYKQTQDQFRPKYDGNSTECSASFTLD